jgi:transposase
MIAASQVDVYLVVGAVDMRKAIDGLSILVSSRFALDPFAGSIFAFSNRRRTMVKLLYWDVNGFALWMKRLDRSKFRWPESRNEVLKMGHRELRWLLDGLEVNQRQAHPALSYAAVY